MVRNFFNSHDFKVRDRMKGLTEVDRNRSEFVGFDIGFMVSKSFPQRACGHAYILKVALGTGDDIDNICRGTGEMMINVKVKVKRSTVDKRRRRSMDLACSTPKCLAWFESRPSVLDGLYLNKVMLLCVCSWFKSGRRAGEWFQLRSNQV